jgi:predicted transcriptional regulator
MLNEEVRKIMTLNPEIAHPEDSIDEISQKLLNNRMQQIPVVDHENHLVGMITSYDLWKQSQLKVDLSKKTVGEIMTKNVIKITPKDKVGTAAELFMDKRFKTLPVVNLRNELKGVITAFDVIKHTLTREYPHPILYSEVFQKQAE